MHQFFVPGSVIMFLVRCSSFLVPYWKFGVEIAVKLDRGGVGINFDQNLLGRCLIICTVLVDCCKNAKINGH